MSVPFRVDYKGQEVVDDMFEIRNDLGLAWAVCV